MGSHKHLNFVNYFLTMINMWVEAEMTNNVNEKAFSYFDWFPFHERIEKPGLAGFLDTISRSVSRFHSCLYDWNCARYQNSTYIVDNSLGLCPIDSK